MGSRTSRRAGANRWLSGLIGIGLAVGLAVPAWKHYYPVTGSFGWTSRVFLDDLPLASALAADGQGGVFVSLEQKRGRGRILRVGADGVRATVKDGLSKLDGMVSYRGGIAYSQEEGGVPVRWWSGDRDEVLFDGYNVEELATDGHYLYAIEDRPDSSRLFRFDPERRSAEILRDRLEVAEGVAVCPDGRLFYVEKKKAAVRQLQAGGTDTLVADGLNEPGFLMCDAEGLWITEDATHMARLLLLDPAGRLRVVLSHLRAAQTILPFGPGRYLLAEQGRNRVLEITR